MKIVRHIMHGSNVYLSFKMAFRANQAQSIKKKKQRRSFNGIYFSGKLVA